MRLCPRVWREKRGGGVRAGRGRDAAPLASYIIYIYYILYILYNIYRGASGQGRDAARQDARRLSFGGASPGGRMLWFTTIYNIYDF